MATLSYFSKTHEAELKNLKSEMNELQQLKDADDDEINELKVQLKILEETRDNFRMELSEASVKFTEGSGNGNSALSESIFKKS